MRFFIITIGLIAIAGIMVTVVVTAVTSDITATATVENIALYIDDATIDYLTLATSGRASTTSDNLNDTQEVGNCGNNVADFAVEGNDSTNWTLETAIDTDKYTHRLCTTTCDTTPHWFLMAEESYLTVTSSMAVHTTSSMDFAIQVPSGTTHYDSQSVNITVQASAP